MKNWSGYTRPFSDMIENHVDSDKLSGLLGVQGYVPAESAEDADLVVVNTCAFIESAREESIETVLDMADRKLDGARLVVTGCMAERYRDELAEALPEVDLVAGFGESLIAPTPVSIGTRRTSDFDLLNLPRPATSAPWAYLKIAEGCDRRLAGRQRRRQVDDFEGNLGPVEDRGRRSDPRRHPVRRRAD